MFDHFFFYTIHIYAPKYFSVPEILKQNQTSIHTNKIPLTMMAVLRHAQNLIMYKPQGSTRLTEHASGGTLGPGSSVSRTSA